MRDFIGGPSHRDNALIDGDDSDGDELDRDTVEAVFVDPMQAFAAIIQAEQLSSSSEDEEDNDGESDESTHGLIIPVGVPRTGVVISTGEGGQREVYYADVMVDVQPGPSSSQSDNDDGVAIPSIRIEGSDTPDADGSSNPNSPDSRTPGSQSDTPTNSTPNSNATPKILSVDEREGDLLKPPGPQSATASPLLLPDQSPDLAVGRKGKIPKCRSFVSDSEDEIRLKESGKKRRVGNLMSSPFFGARSELGQSSPHLGGSSPFYSNPMESELEGENLEACRGDCIGSTNYSERHVIKILMKWMKELERTVQEEEESDGDAEEETTDDPDGSVPNPLAKDLDEELSLLWDLSSESDVIQYLVEKNVYMLIKDTLSVSNCSRLKEISLGIFANLLSSREALNNFPTVESESELGLIVAVISEIQGSSNVELLVQAYSVLERIVWYINKVRVNISWLLAILNLEFVNVINFSLRSSTNALLLGKIILTILPLFEALNRETVFENLEAEGEVTALVDCAIEFEIRMTQNYDVFCETNFVPSLCEGLHELLKISFESETDIDDFQIPPGHVQTALCSGLSCLCYLQKFKSGLNVLGKESRVITSFLEEFFPKFHLCSERIEISIAFDHFSAGLNLMSFCLLQSQPFQELERNAVTKPLQAGLRLSKREELKEAKGDELDLLHSIGIVLHEHLAELGDGFGLEKVYSYIEGNEELSPLSKFMDEAVKYFEEKAKGQAANEESQRQAHRQAIQNWVEEVD